MRPERVSYLGVEDNNNRGGVKEGRRRWKQQVCDDPRGSCGGDQKFVAVFGEAQGGQVVGCCVPRLARPEPVPQECDFQE